MNTSLLTNLLTYSVGVSPVASKKPPATKNAGQFVVPAPAGSSPPPNTPETTTADNTSTVAKQMSTNEQMQQSCHVPGKKTVTAKLQNGQPGTGSEGQTPAFGAAFAPNVVQVVQSWLAQYPLVEHGKEGLAREMQPKAGCELARLLANLRAAEFPPGAAQTPKPAENHPLIAVGEGQLGPKAVLPDTAGGIFAAGTQPVEHKNVDKIQESNKALPTTKALPAQENKELAVSTDGEPTVDGGKPPILDNSAASGSQKAPSSNSKELIPQATAGGNKAVAGSSKAATDGSKAVVVTEKPLTAEEPAASVARKTPVLNDGFPVAQDKLTDLQQKVPLGPEKSAFVAEKPTPSKANIAQQANPGASVLPEESSGSDGKQQGGNLLGDSILNKLNPAQVRVSTKQTKDPGNSASNNASDSDFEQMLSSDNARTPIADQTSAFSPVAKAAGRPSPSDGFANIGEQIQGTISSSIRRGDQQINIQLYPPELGRVFIKFREQQGQITGLLQVDKIQTRHEIEQVLPQIVRNLADAGVQIKRLEVTLTDQPQQQPYKDQSLQDGWSHHQPGAEGKSPDSNASSTNQWLTNDGSYPAFSQPQQMLVTDDSINMLV